MIEFAIALAVVIYVLGIVVIATTGLVAWGIAQSMIRHGQREMVGSEVPDFWEANLSRDRADAHAAARKIVNAWLWPITAAGAVVLIYRDSKSR